MTRARAFGLDLDARFELAGFEDEEAPSAGAGAGRGVRLELASERDLLACAGDEPAERIAQAEANDGRPVASIDSFGRRGYAAWAERFGRAWMDADGRAILCTPVDAPAWLWQRFLVGQLLPFAAVLRDLEVFHASAVVLDGRAVAVVAGSGAGKTSLALELVMRGFAFLNDDVLVVEHADGRRLVVHPGAPLANIRRDGGTLAERLIAARMGRVLGSGDDETRVVLRRHGEPVPLAAIFFVRRSASGGRGAVDRMGTVDPRLLIAATFNRAVRSPERLARQLDVCGRVAESAALFRVDAPPQVTPAELAEKIHESALALEAAAW
jgi:hypothetical protein